MPQERPDSQPARRPAVVFARVMIVQVIALGLLWVMQSVFGQG